MAVIAFDSASQQITSSTGSNSLSFNNVAGNFMVVFLYDNSSSTTGVTYNGVSLTDTGITVVKSASNQFTGYAFYLKSPATGANTLTASRSSSTGDYYLHVATYSGAGTTQPDNAAATTEASSSTMTQTITVNTANSWTVCSAFADGGSLAASTGSTLRGSIINTVTGLFDSNAAMAAGSQSMVQTMNGTFKRVGIIMSIKPIVAASSGFFAFF
jgi:hypothetical protein